MTRCVCPDYLTNLRDEAGQPLGFSGNHTDFWHSDQEYRENPATLGILYCVIPSPTGGTTSFASTAVNNLELPDEVIEKIRELQVTYVPASTHDNVKHVEVVHPLFLTSPCGKETIYVSENAKRFIGVETQEGQNLKEQLLNAILHNENIYSHSWRMGDLILFDNTQLIHRRNEFEGIRWLKSTKIFARQEMFAIPYGEVLGKDTEVKEVTVVQDKMKLASVDLSVGSETSERNVKKVTARAFSHYDSDRNLAVPKFQFIRAGKAGGLPFDSLTTDLNLGCLPPSKICYGDCFAARAAFNSGFNFGKRVENVLDEEVFLHDLNALPKSQGYLRNGWNSDPSWSWEKALKLSDMIHKSERHTIFITKCFITPSEEIMLGLAGMGVEIRVSISAFDTKVQLEQRIEMIEKYREHGGVAVPLIMTTRFKDQALNDKQDRIVQYIVNHDLPAAENSLRFNPNSPVLELIDESSCGRVAESGDLWCGRLYSDEVIRVPTTTTIPPNYRGLQSPYLSKNDPQYLKSLWHDPVHTHAEVLSRPSLDKPAKCGVSIAWDKVEVAT